MKRLIVACMCVAVAAYATAAWSSAGMTPTEKHLQKQITTLQKQVKQLRSDTGVALVVLELVQACGEEMTADALQGTWQEVDQLSAATQAGKTYFGPQTPAASSVAGQDACAALKLARSQALPPTTTQLQQLITGLTSLRASSAFASRR